jgi:hypothetical protein
MEALGPMFIFPNPTTVPTVPYEYLFYHPQATGFGHPLDRRLMNYYRGLVP